MSQYDRSNYYEQSVTPEEVRGELSVIENLMSQLSGKDNYMEAMLHNQRLQLMKMLQQMEQWDRLFAIGELTELPPGAVGQTIDEIPEGQYGAAVFQLTGSNRMIEVRADEDLRAFDTVEIIDEGNLVERRPGASRIFSTAGTNFTYRGQTISIPPVITSDQKVFVSNQRYIQGEYETISPTLAAGEEKTVAEVNVGSDELYLLSKTNASMHETVEYTYSVDGEVDSDLSGTSPWATPPGFYEPHNDGYLVAESSVRLDLREMSEERSYSDVTGTLVGLKLRGA